ncbi:hypothetical protein JAAARDRAFT_133195 [Jaapia argillacea MUCL 33604]|uniref:Carbonic anhydrase n=1 Tax=Jaapia argillacea MUCL 33604 TaxID=933084 RepID=A0A067PQW2_9AGAM|nr:hypothetical protein JAAARDRAFT_133195 [Jaapia argillacea MUCL 33604]
MAQFPVLAKLLAQNVHWAKEVEEEDPGFFERSAQGQSPKVLWIGCADSRVPESVITASKPGDIFVHRNIANQFPLDDVNAEAVLEYAVGHLKVEHVIIVGHSKCGGAAACLAAAQHPSGLPDPDAGPNAPLNVWLASLVELARSLVDPTEELLIQDNIKAQVANAVKSHTIKEAWAHGKKVYVHGWLYELEKGHLRDLGITQGPKEPK